MEQKEKIRPIYSELQGYLSQAPDVKTSVTYESDLWEQYNSTINELNNISGNNYDRFKISPKNDGSGEFRMKIVSYRSKLSGLISRLHGELFSDEQPPFSSMPSTVISQTQQQSQSFQVQLLLEIQSKIDEKLNELEPEDKKRGFLEKVKGALTSVHNTAELIALILSTGQQFDLTIKELWELFK